MREAGEGGYSGYFGREVHRAGQAWPHKPPKAGFTDYSTPNQKGPCSGSKVPWVSNFALSTCKPVYQWVPYNHPYTPHTHQTILLVRWTRAGIRAGV